MKIIKLGVVKSKEKEEKVKTCYRCKTLFSYTLADVQSDREGTYVVCPNNDCKSFIDTKI